MKYDSSVHENVFMGQWYQYNHSFLFTDWLYFSSSIRAFSIISAIS